MVKQMFGRDLDSGRTTLVDYIDGHDAATVIVKKPHKGSNNNAANWRVWSRTREPRNRLFFQFLHDSPLPSQTDKYVEEAAVSGRSRLGSPQRGTRAGGPRATTETWKSFKIPTNLRFMIAEPSQAA